MGRHHALKPQHLCLSTTTSSSHSPAPFPFFKSSYPSPKTLFQTSPVAALAVGDRIPGFKVSAAFLSSLHSNIFIELDSGVDSTANTPDIPQPSSSPPSPFFASMSTLSDADFAPPSALDLPKSSTETSDDVTTNVSAEPEVGEDGLPILKTFLVQTDDMRVEALHMVADSVAQQRNMTSKILIYNPVTAAIIVAMFAGIRQYFYMGEVTDYIKILMTFTGSVMALLGGIRLICGPYIFEAEKVGTWKWLQKGRSVEEEENTGLRVLGDSDDILLTKFGGEYIGAIIFRGVQPAPVPGSPAGNKRTRRAQSPSKQNKMVIRAWTVRQKYRRKEIGSVLIEEALKVGKERGWLVGGAEIAEDHANSVRILPASLNGPLDKFDKIAQKTLDKKLDEFDASQEKGRKKR